MAKETQIKLTKTRYRLGCLGVTTMSNLPFCDLHSIDCDRAAVLCSSLTVPVLLLPRKCSTH